MQQFHNILHHIDKRCNLHQSPEANKPKLELLQFYSKGKGFTETNYKKSSAAESKTQLYTNVVGVMS